MVEFSKGNLFGVFPTGAKAKLVVNDLYYADFRDDQIGIVTRDGTVKDAETPVTAAEKSATAGAAAGAVAGGTLGAAAGLLAANLVPGFGAVLTGGVITSVVWSTLLGAAGGNMIGAFIGMGLSEQEAAEFERDFRAGYTIVLVKPEGRDREVIDVFKKHDAIRISTYAPPPKG